MSAAYRYPWVVAFVYILALSAGRSLLKSLTGLEVNLTFLVAVLALAIAIRAREGNEKYDVQAKPSKHVA